MGQERDTWAFGGEESGTATGPGPWTHGASRAEAGPRPDRAVQYERALGLALWLLLGVVLFGLS